MSNKVKGLSQSCVFKYWCTPFSLNSFRFDWIFCKQNSKNLLLSIASIWKKENELELMAFARLTTIKIPFPNISSTLIFYGLNSYFPFKIWFFLPIYPGLTSLSSLSIKIAHTFSNFQASQNGFTYFAMK